MPCARPDVAQAPVTLTLIGEVAAGHPFDGTVEAGQAVRIFTGGVVPDWRRHRRRSRRTPRAMATG